MIYIIRKCERHQYEYKVFHGKQKCPLCNAEKQKEYNRKNYKKNYKNRDIERNNSANRKWYAKNKDKRKQKMLEYQQLTLDQYLFRQNLREASKLQRTPKWLTKEQINEIKEFYILAKELQWLSDPTDPLEVDHIIPLRGKNVSGLHVPWNLQILPKSLNIKKSNKF